MDLSKLHTKIDILENTPSSVDTLYDRINKYIDPRILALMIGIICWFIYTNYKSNNVSHTNYVI